MAALRKVNGKYVNQLLLAIKTQQKNPEFDGRIALRVLNRIASISIEHDLSLDRELIIQVCQICTRKMTDSIRNQDSSVSMNGLVRLYSRVLSRNILQAFYNPQLIEHMIRHVNDQFGKWTLEEMYCLLYNLSGFGHYDKSLLEKFYFMFLENYESYMNQSSIKPSGLIFAYFTPLRFDKFDLKHLFNLVLNPKKMKDLHKDFDMLSSIVLNLCTLEVYEPIEVFEKFADYLHKESFYPITRKYTLKTLRVLLIEMQNNKFPSAFTKAHQPRIEQILDQVGQDAYFSIQKKSSAAFDLSQFIGRDYLISNSILTRSGFLLENVAIYDSSERKFVRVCDYDMDVKFLDDIKLAANQHL